MITKKTKKTRGAPKAAEPTLPRTHSPFANPFPRTAPSGKVIIDEMCACKARRTKHGPGPYGAFGHGECVGTGCKQFTWIKMIYAPPAP